MTTPVTEQPTQTTPPPEKPTQGFDATRPFRYGWRFLSGTLMGTGNGIGEGGRKGFLAGLAIGVLCCIGGGLSAGTLFLPAIYGLLIGGVVGGVFGVATGGVKRVMKGAKKEDDEAARATGGIAVQGRDFRDVYRQKDRAGDYNFERMMQQEREDRRDYNTYWQDHVNGGRDSYGGRGF